MSWYQAPAPLVPDLIAQNGRWLADRPALVDGAVSLTWQDFAAATACVANGLARLGVRSNERVAVLMDSRAETVLTLFGILRAGAVAVPLNVSVNDAAVAAMCADAGCVAVFASGAHCARIDALRSSGALAARDFIGCDAPGGDWHDFQAFVAAQPASAPAVSISPDDECNLIYSSGTTALPKGIVHTHACRMHWAYDAALALRYRSGCRTLLTLGLFSNISWVGMLSTILVGGTLVLSRTFSAREALAVIERERITHGAFVPVQLERLLACPERRAVRTDSLETLMCCGSAVAAEVKRGVAREFNCRLIELYGLTEGYSPSSSPRRSSAKFSRSASRCSVRTFASSARTTARPRPVKRGDRRPQPADDGRLSWARGCESRGDLGRSARRSMAAHRRPRSSR